MCQLPADVAAVSVVDGDEGTRGSTARLLEQAGLSIGAFASAEELRGSGLLPHSGCLVLDVGAPVRGGLDLHEELLGEGHRIPVIFLAADADVPTAVRAMKAGAFDFLRKPIDGRALLRCVLAALKLDRSHRERASRWHETDLLISRLSTREKETLDLILAGVPNKAMAARLKVSERAIELRRANIMKKLDVRTPADLFERVITHRVLADLRRTPFPG